jgi:hypothetical protein
METRARLSRMSSQTCHEQHAEVLGMSQLTFGERHHGRLLTHLGCQRKHSLRELKHPWEDVVSHVANYVSVDVYVDIPCDVLRSIPHVL